MFKIVVLVVIMIMMMSANVYAFQTNRIISKKLSSSLKLAEESSEPEFEPDADNNLFDMNRIVRLGRSRDQDGKSNIWSIEPAMEVEEDEEEGDGAKKNLFIGAAVIVTAIAALPLFNAFSGLFPDPTDF